MKSSFIYLKLLSIKMQRLLEGKHINEGKGLAIGMKINLRCDLISSTFLLYNIILWNLLNLLFIKYKIGIPHCLAI